MSTLLELTAHLPEVTVPAGHELMRDGDRTGRIWVLVEGELQILKDGNLINTISRPGAAFGEVSVLLDSNHTATVVAARECRLRKADDGRAFLLGSPEVLLHLASGLAERLDVVTRYLSDLRTQYAEAPGLQMVSTVLGKLVNEERPTIRPGSARDPEPDLPES